MGHSLTQTRLDESQMLLVGATARYLSLFLIATLSSTITLSVYALSSSLFEVEIWSIVSAVDCSTNITCLYLQYAFAVDYYDLYCAKVSVCCKAAIIRRM